MNKQELWRRDGIACGKASLEASKLLSSSNWSFEVQRSVSNDCGKHLQIIIDTLRMKFPAELLNVVQTFAS